MSAIEALLRIDADSQNSSLSLNALDFRVSITTPIGRLPKCALPPQFMDHVKPKLS